MLTSPRLYQALLQETFRINSPKKILAVGAQIPALLIKLIKSLKNGDELVICDGTSSQLASLEQRLLLEEAYRSRTSQIQLLNAMPWEMDQPHYYNSIVLSYPIDLLSDEQLDLVMDACANLLVQGGTLSCLELAWIRKLKDFISVCWKKNSCQPVLPSKLEHYIDSFRVYKETVATNLPPVWINHLRFTPSAVQAVPDIHAVEGRASLALGPIKIAKDFLKFILPLGGAAALLRKYGATLWYLPLLLLTGIAAFLRDPRRTIQEDHNAVLSACDGTVLEVAEVSDPKLGQGKWLRIATFLSLTNVHINRAPVYGKIIDTFTVSGGCARANLPEATHNHACYTILQSIHGPVCVVQRVGSVARRIFNWVNHGEVLAQGERYGLIRMGSRTDVYLPAGSYSAAVQKGDKIEAGTTVIARFNSEPAQ